MHRAPSFAGFGRGHSRQPYPQFCLERQIPVHVTYQFKKIVYSHNSQFFFFFLVLFLAFDYLHGDGT